MSTEHLNFHKIDVCLFDILGTILNWHSTVTRQVTCLSKRLLLEGSQDAVNFAEEWRAGYCDHVKRVLQDGEGTFNADIIHQQIMHSPCILDNIDTIPSLTELKHHINILTLSNGNFRLLLDLAKNQGVPWDGIFTSKLSRSYKLNKKVYQSTAYHLYLPPHKIAMVTVHRFDLITASSIGFKTMYVPCPTEDLHEVRESMHSKKDGGEVDLLVKDFEQLVRLICEAQ
ncbi:HAD-like domain-containing protein [Suillus subaureus]|uniref:HAD-like domain-containing protein n=1 Tax=Suillus subaureus TaxID=48587 RepID=A0A9P7EJS5_9AGAM|nr:HAD-like domain-containing protein [Suillus subaureus]KAG1823898.1 HAD-like domain-containing protein [Suillus subaureus]